MSEFKFSIGNHNEDSHPKNYVADSFVDMVNFLKGKSISTDKGMRYFAAAFEDDHTGKPHRCNDGALDTHFLAFDFDKLKDEEAWLGVQAFFSGWHRWEYATSSHMVAGKDGMIRPKARIILEASRCMTRIERKRVSMAINAKLLAQVPDAVETDVSVFNSAQAIYLPLKNTAFNNLIDGDPVNVDQWLKDAPEITPSIHSMSVLSAPGDPGDDRDLAKLFERGMVLKELAQGKYAVICPFEHEHSSKTAESSTVYFAEGFNGKESSFSCLHSHGGKPKSRAEMLTELHFPGSHANEIDVDALIKKSEEKKLMEQTNPFSGLMSMAVTDEMVEMIEDAKFAWLSLIPQGHMTVFCAEANGGKTTIMVHAAAQMAADGYKVLYINSDASASDIKHYHEHATDHGYTLINPDISGGNNEKVVQHLTWVADNQDDCSDTVIVLDTLKKFTDMMVKSKNKQFYEVLRKLTTKGMTVVTLAHTNKYAGEDGKPVFEGTNDLRNDFDNLIYMIPVKNQDGSMTVTTVHGKSRADLVHVTFEISPDREVTLLPNKVDTLAISQMQKSLKADGEIIEFIKTNIRFAAKTAAELYEISKADSGFSRREIKKILERHTSGHSPEPLWLSLPGKTNGTRYGLITDEYKAQLQSDWRNQ